MPLTLVLYYLNDCTVIILLTRLKYQFFLYFILLLFSFLFFSVTAISCCIFMNVSIII